MSLSKAVARIKESLPAFEAVVRPSPAPLPQLLSAISDVQCSATDFKLSMQQLTANQAAMLVTATLHRSMAYSSELLPLQEARSLSGALIAAAGSNAEYFSNCQVDDEVSGIGGWSFMVTSHTFESVLYCVGQHETALLVLIDED